MVEYFKAAKKLFDITEDLNHPEVIQIILEGSQKIIEKARQQDCEELES